MTFKDNVAPAASDFQVLGLDAEMLVDVILTPLEGLGYASGQLPGGSVLFMPPSQVNGVAFEGSYQYHIRPDSEWFFAGTDLDTLTGHVSAHGKDLDYYINAATPPYRDEFDLTFREPSGSTKLVHFVVKLRDAAEVEAFPDAAEAFHQGEVFIDVTANDEQIDDLPLTIVSATNGSRGSTQVIANKVRYYQDGPFGPTDSFTYTIQDQFGHTSTSTVYLTLVEPYVKITSSAGSGPGSLAAGFQEINDNIAPGPWTVRVDPASLPSGILDVDTPASTDNGPSAMVITKDVTFDGAQFPGLTIRRPAGAPDMRLFYVAPSGTLTLNNLILTGGRISSNTVPAQGGAILNHGYLYVNYCTLQENTATSTVPGQAQGGAVASETPGGEVIIDSSRFLANNAVNGQGGAVYYSASDYNELFCNTFWENTAPHGSAVYLNGNYSYVGIADFADNGPGLELEAVGTPASPALVDAEKLRITTQSAPWVRIGNSTSSGAVGTINVTTSAPIGLPHDQVFSAFNSSINQLKNLSLNGAGSNRTLTFEKNGAGNFGHLGLSVTENNVTYTEYFNGIVRPWAADDRYGASGPMRIKIADLLANDQGTAPGSLSFGGISNVAFGQCTVMGDELLVVPSPSVQVARFDYTIVDSGGGNDVGQVLLDDRAPEGTLYYKPKVEVGPAGVLLTMYGDRVRNAIWYAKDDLDDGEWEIIGYTYSDLEGASHLVDPRADQLKHRYYRVQEMNVNQ